MLTTNSKRFVLVLRALASVATPICAGCSPVESTRSDATDGGDATATADSGVDPVCANELVAWTLADLMNRGFCSRPSGGDPLDTFRDGGPDGAFQGQLAPQPTDERVLGRPCFETNARCDWPGAPATLGGPPIGYACSPTACTRPGGTGFTWSYTHYSNGAGPMAPPELEG